MAPTEPIPMDMLLAQADWARRLARRLVRDEPSADDLVQRTWIAALEHPPRGTDPSASSPARGWLASVMRNFARQDARANERRRQRERAASRPESSNGDEVEHGLELQQGLLTALRALAEPYRGALYARYFKGLAPCEIALRQNVPLKTVKSRLARGLTLLRERLDREHGGDRRAWLVWIAPLAAKPALPLGILGVLLVDTKLKLAAALAVAVCALAVGTHLVRSGVESPAPSAVIAATQQALDMPQQENLPAIGTSTERTGVARPASDAVPIVPVAAKQAELVRGRVLDLANRAVSGVHIVLEARLDLPSGVASPKIPEDLRSNARGEFEFRQVKANGQLVVADDRWVTVFKAQLSHAPSEGELAIVVAPRIDFQGIVVDATHRPISGAKLELLPSASIKRNLEQRLDLAIQQFFGAQADEVGRFTLASVPACEAQIHTTANGFEDGWIAAPTLSTTDLEIVLVPRVQRPAIVRGLVLDAARAPLAGATVALGGQTQVTSADGRFEFDLDADFTTDMATQDSSGLWAKQYPRDRVRAAKAGLLPADAEIPAIEALREQQVPHEVTLVLAGESLTIRGTVIGPGGTPLGRVEVKLLDETPFGVSYDHEGGAMISRETTVEALLRGGDAYNPRNLAAGEFELSGLTDRRYDLAAIDMTSLRYAVLRGVAAGDHDVVIELPSDECLRHVAGRVLSRSGVGLADIDLHAGRSFGLSQYANPLRTVTTDAQGRFDLGMIDPTDLRMQVIGEEIFLIMAWQPPQGAKLDELEIVVSQRCSVRVELSSGGQAADAFAFLDGSGAPTQNFQFEGRMINMPERCEIVDGRSEVCATEDTARTLLLFQGGREVARVPVQLVPGQLVVLRP